MVDGPREGRPSRPHRPPPTAVGESRIPDSYIVILQPTVTPYEMLSSVLKGYKPTFTYGSIFTGFAVDRVPMQKADEVSVWKREGWVEVLRICFSLSLAAVFFVACCSVVSLFFKSDANPLPSESCV